MLRTATLDNHEVVDYVRYGQGIVKPREFLLGSPPFQRQGIYIERRPADSLGTQD